MADPFILRERFQGVQKSTLSSASISMGFGAAQPGGGAEAAGAKIQAFGDRIHALAVKKRDTYNALAAHADTTSFIQDVTKEQLNIAKELGWDNKAMTYKTKLDEDGNSMSYYKAMSQMIEDKRKKYYTGDRFRDDAFRRTSASAFQSLLLEASAAGIKLDVDKTKQVYKLAVSQASGLYADETKKYIAEHIKQGLNPNTLLLDLDKKVVELWGNLDNSNIKLSKPAVDQLRLDTRSAFTEQLLEQLLLTENLDVIDNILELGSKRGKLGVPDKGKKEGGHLYYLKPAVQKSLERKVKSVRGQVPPGRRMLLSNQENNIIQQVLNGQAVDKAITDIQIAFKNSNLKSGEIEVRLDLLNAKVGAASDFRIASKNLETIPLKSHGSEISKFEVKHGYGQVAAFSLVLKDQLNSRSDALRKEFIKDKAQYTLIHHNPTTLKAEAWNLAKQQYQKERYEGKNPNLKTVSNLGEQMIESSLQFQKDFSDTLDPVTYQTKNVIKNVIRKFNDDTRTLKSENEDQLKQQIADYFDFFGKYGGNVFNELLEPQRYMNYKGEKLNPAVGAAMTYADTEVFARLIYSSNNSTKFRDPTIWVKNYVADVNSALKENQHFSEIMSAYGYIGHIDDSNVFHSVVVDYILSLAHEDKGKPGNERSHMDEYIDRAVDDLIHSKYDTEAFVNDFGLISEHKYLSIPREDNKGRIYDVEKVAGALEVIKEDPSLIGLEGEEAIIFKKSGVVLNSEDGSGIVLGYYDDKVNKMITLDDRQPDGTSKYRIPWTNLNAKNYPEVFSKIPPSTPEKIRKGINYILNSYSEVPTSEAYQLKHTYEQLGLWNPKVDYFGNMTAKQQVVYMLEKMEKFYDKNLHVEPKELWKDGLRTIRRFYKKAGLMREGELKLK